MKKFILLSIIATIFMSCEGKDGKDGRDGLLSVWRVIELPVSAADWQPSAPINPAYYSVTFDVPEITSDIFLDGVVLCYLYGNGRQIILPSMRHLNNGNAYIDFEYYAGGAEIFYTPDTPVPPSEKMTFVLQILY